MKTLTAVLFLAGYVLPAPISWALVGLAFVTMLVHSFVILTDQFRLERAARHEAAHRADVEFWTKVYERPTSPARQLVAAQMLDYLDA
jgi:hypothetical protein